MSDQSLVRLTGITKTYPGVDALRSVDFDLEAGDVHCLVGENGAGKSTLMRIITGAERPDNGRILIGGREIRALRPADAHHLGVSAIYQETHLVPDLTVAENIFLGHEPRTRLGLIDRDTMRSTAQRLLDQLETSALSVDGPVHGLSAANVQLVQIVKALSRASSVLIMDEPGAVLSDHELEKLFATVQYLRRRGLGIIYISHRLNELQRVGDRVTVMRDGESVLSSPLDSLSQGDIIRAMVGRDLDSHYPRSTTNSSGVQNDVVLSAEALTVRGRFTDVDISLRRGEILGLAGLVGAGRSSLLSCLFGALRADGGTVTIAGTRVALRHPRQAIEMGITLAPEDRRGAGVLLSRSVQENITLASLTTLRPRLFVREGRLASLTNKYVDALRVKTPSNMQPVALLSGGNQQKVVLAKWLARGTSILLLDEPTAGIDVGAKQELYTLIDGLAAEGVSIVIASSDLSEILGMSDRIMVMAEGRVTGELSRAEATQERIMEHAVPGAVGA